MSTFIQPHIVPVCLPSSRRHFAGSKAWVTGWGKVHDGFSHDFQSSAHNQNSIPLVISSIRISLTEEYFLQIQKWRSLMSSELRKVEVDFSFLLYSLKALEFCLEQWILINAFFIRFLFFLSRSIRVMQYGCPLSIEY